MSGAVELEGDGVANGGFDGVWRERETALGYVDQMIAIKRSSAEVLLINMKRDMSGDIRCRCKAQEGNSDGAKDGDLHFEYCLKE